MAKHKSLKDAIREKEFRQMIADSLQKQYTRGMLIGSRSMLKVVADKIAEKDGTAEEKLAEVMKMINNLLTMTDKTAEGEQAEIPNPVDEALGKSDAVENEDEGQSQDITTVTLPDAEVQE